MVQPVLQFCALHPWAAPVIIIVTCAILGAILEHYSQHYFYYFFSKLKIQVEPTYYKAFSRFIVLWSIFIGVTLIKIFFPFSHKVLVALHKGLVSIVIFTFALFIADLLIVIIREKIGKGPMDLPTTTLTINLIKISILTSSILIIFSFLGIAIAPLLTALGVGSLAVALGLHDTLSNFFAGIYILKSKIITIQDYVQLDSGQEGYVIDVGLRAIHLKTFANNIVYVPTAKASQSIITNFSHPNLDFSVGVDLRVENNSDLDKVEQVTLETAKKVVKEFGLSPTNPYIRFQSMGDTGIQFTVFLRTIDMNKRLLLISEFLKAIQKAFRESDIHLAYPHRVVNLANNSESQQTGDP